MNLWYRILGYIAYLNERASHTRVNFIPVNWVLALMWIPLLGMCLLFAEENAKSSKDVIGNNIGIATFILLSLVSLLFAATFFMRYLVFQKIGGKTTRASSALNSIASSPIPISDKFLGVTGRFVLDEKNAGRFLDVPAQMQITESGDVAFYSRINASSRTYGVVTKERIGIWYLLMQANRVQEVQTGNLYLKTSRPALRVRHTDGVTQKPATSFLTFDSEAERQLALQKLSQFLTA